MASHKSALKRIKQTQTRTERNRSHRSRLHHQLRRMDRALNSKDKSAAQSLFVPTVALIDHSIRNGILHKNTAARYKSRLANRLNALS